MEIRQRLLDIVAKEDLLEQAPMKEYVTFRAGGPARYLVFPNGEDELAAVMQVCRTKGVPYLILGRGSNLLVSDRGFDGAVISLRRHFCSVDADERTGILTAGAGALMPSAALAALGAGLSGLEFASGIPGTVGGGVLMNAGAYGGEIRQVLLDVRVMDGEGNVQTVLAGEAGLSYRDSVFLHDGRIVLSCRMQLHPDEKAQIKARMDDFNARRREKQPLEYASAGSTFKRPAGYFAGKLIQDCGLKGFCVGDAQVSEKHAGFVINRKEATASQIYSLCRQVQERVKEQTGVRLELEVRLAGDFPEPDFSDTF